MNQFAKPDLNYEPSPQKNLKLTETLSYLLLTFKVQQAQLKLKETGHVTLCKSEEGR